MPTISVRISEDEKRRLLRYGKLSTSVREALDQYLQARKSREIIDKLEGLQRRNPIRTTSAHEVSLIREDRRR